MNFEPAGIWDLWTECSYSQMRTVPDANDNLFQGFSELQRQLLWAGLVLQWDNSV